ncbi:hypothetical protein GGR20_001303 [Devosia subaequoris]|uniref:Uncharacterized protein n=1 Tax=Devosia subaequoris TaxID=395930 RepID=A0A7W6IM39_9HYPH|nr:hypothetical protein [Devosia subaequoris]MBB4051667.1 hypothetical protein [Devosia subaequoris]MCP1209254.1 hypothetical protein [Devosia subaequoris]
MTIKSALSAIALSAGLMAAPAFAQTMMIGTQTVAETDVGAVKARCERLKLADESQSLSSTEDAENENEASVVGDADIVDVPDAQAETAVSVDLDLITLEQCMEGDWLEDHM